MGGISNRVKILKQFWNVSSAFQFTPSSIKVYIDFIRVEKSVLKVTPVIIISIV